MPNWGGGASGAASGAATGSMFGPWGTAVGAGVGGLMGLFSGGGDKDKKQKAEADQLEVQNLLKSRAEKMSQQGEAASAQGDMALSPVLDYFKKLIGGDPAAMLEATAPERGRVIDQYDTARRAVAEFAPRGGGQGAAISGSYVQQAQQLGDITSTARQGAVQGLAELGPQLKMIGMTAEQLASADLNTVIQAVLARQGMDLQRRGQNIGAITGVGEAVGSLLGQYLTREGGAWGPKGTGVAMT